MKKTLALVLTLVMALTMMCPALADSSNFNPDGEYPLLKEKVALTVGIGQHANVEDWETNWQTKLIEELANVDLTFVTYGNEMMSQITLAITSEAELPDILISNATSGGLSLELLYQWALAGKLVPLTDYVDQYGY